MHIDIITLFPDMLAGPLSESILKRAQEKGKVSLKIHNLRNWTQDKHKTVDGRPFGGGPGMVMMIEPIDKALKDLRKVDSHVILTSAKGAQYKQTRAQELSKKEHLIIIAGHYEGIDHRVEKYLVDEDISIGDYVLTGGELPALVIVDSIVRLLPGVLGDETSIIEESHSQPGYLEYPQYTRPEDYQGWKVPDVLLSGNHGAIKKWREEKAKTTQYTSVKKAI